MDEQRDTEGIRGDELADTAGGAGSTPDREELAEQGIRGQGLAEDARSQPGGTPDPDTLGGDGLRGEGLADSA
jgi:hypothetical protein